ncbi:MAG: discoidin domain-containing protein [Chloroflexi bacterium]|nr:discoidin domain-containing protein [Chloroflexota bacterium]MBU1746819.1 discoidin domain-containing protein [Chloroflexota bacterium]
MSSGKIGIVVTLLLGLMALAAVDLSASAGPGTRQELSLDGLSLTSIEASRMKASPGADHVGHLTIAATDTLTNTMYLPVVQNCYGPCGVCKRHGHGGTEVITTSSSSCLAAEIRIDLYTRALTAYGFSLFEVEAYGPDDPGKTTNLLTSGRACASSIEANNPVWHPCQVLDGSMSTRWASDWGEPQWLVIVLSEPQLVKYVVLKWEAAYAIEYQVIVMNPMDTNGAQCPACPSPSTSPLCPQ